MDDASAAKRIFADEIQILVDLNGYTKDARTRVFARRPAPVNVNWFGYPGTMGSPYHHYIVADDTIIPPELEAFYTEKVLRLPCYQPNDRKRIIAQQSPTRAEAGLPEGEIVFCCLNGLQKLNMPTFALWMKILATVPRSVLWLLSGTPETNERLRRAGAQFGIAPDRIVFAQKKSNGEHLARYSLADMFLDNMPYGAHTTAADSLWMGVPVLTLPGSGFAARVCASVIRAAGGDELIATDADDYVGRAVTLARDRPRLHALRKRLIDNRDTCALFDTPQLVRALEALYRQMWSDFVRGNLPRPDLRNLDIYADIALELDHEAIGLLNAADYPSIYRAALQHRDRFSPIGPDLRLWRGAGD